MPNYRLWAGVFFQLFFQRRKIDDRKALISNSGQSESVQAQEKCVVNFLYGCDCGEVFALLRH